MGRECSLMRCTWRCCSIDRFARHSILDRTFWWRAALPKPMGSPGCDVVGCWPHQNDLFGNIPAHITERLSVCALDNLERIRARAKGLLAANWKILDVFLAKHPELEVVRPLGGTIIF